MKKHRRNHRTGEPARIPPRSALGRQRGEEPPPMIARLQCDVSRGGKEAAALDELSLYNSRFLDFAKRHPEAFNRSSFAVLDDKTPFVKYPLQSWPTFVRTAAVEEMAAAVRSICKLIKAVPERHFHLDPQRLASYYRLDPGYAGLLAALFADRSYIDGLLARGDFVRTAAGFLCLEVNMSSNLGGWRATVWERLYMQVPLIARFLTEQAIEPSHRDAVATLFEHLVERACQKRLIERELNVAFVVPPENRSAEAVREFGRSKLAAALRRRGADLLGE